MTGTKASATRGTTTKAFSDEESAAMKERAREAKKSSRSADAEGEVLAKIAEMHEEDRGIAERLHALITANAPELSPKTWYGMPAYAKNGKIVCFFQPAKKFKTRYATLGFNDAANLDDGTIWPTAYALTKLTAETEKKIAALVTQAAS